MKFNFFFGSKLSRIDVDAHDDDSMFAHLSSRQPDQAQVAAVQVTHRGDKANTHARLLPTAGLLLHRLNRPHDSHREKVVQLS